MRSIVCPELGPPSVLIVQERPDPTPQPGQVVIEVAAAGVNFVDALFVAGTYQIKPPVPFVPGSEVAGVVTAVGGGVGPLAIGDRVVTMCGLGGWSTQIAVGAAQAVRVPHELDLPRAATFIQSYCTALFALRDRAHLGTGETVLVLGAGGGVGLAAIDVARMLGATVIAVASTASKRDAAVAAGASSVIDPTVEDVKARARELSDGGVDVVIDPVGGDLADAGLRALGLYGRLVVIGFASGTIPRLPLNQVLLRNRSIVGVDWGAWAMANGAANQALLDELLAHVAGDTLHPSAPTEYRFDQAAIALDDLTNRRVVGKVALVP
jgi:NADPH2:quinone reductase